eukprot:s3657_g5.t1
MLHIVPFRALGLEGDISGRLFSIIRSSWQGVSTIAWSLATLDMVTSLDTYNFFNLAAQVAAANIRAYPPQAIANCCWAFNRLGRKEAVLSRFGKAAAEEAMRRIDEFSWQDLQGSAQH